MALGNLKMPDFCQKPEKSLAWTKTSENRKLWLFFFSNLNCSLIITTDCFYIVLFSALVACDFQWVTVACRHFVKYYHMLKAVWNCVLILVANVLDVKKWLSCLQLFIRLYWGIYTSQIVNHSCCSRKQVLPPTLWLKKPQWLLTQLTPSKLKKY